jgi:hypothetical protein
MRTIRYFRFNRDASKRRSKEQIEVFGDLLAIRVCDVRSHKADFRLAPGLAGLLTFTPKVGFTT